MKNLQWKKKRTVNQRKEEERERREMSRKEARTGGLHTRAQHDVHAYANWILIFTQPRGTILKACGASRSSALSTYVSCIAKIQFTDK